MFTKVGAAVLLFVGAVSAECGGIFANKYTDA